MALIFCGDFAVPFGCEINYETLRPIFKGKKSVVNLEGALLNESSEYETRRRDDKYSLFNTREGAEHMISEIHPVALNMLNNHTLDFPFPVERTIDYFNEKDIKVLGKTNSDCCEIEVDGNRVLLVSFTLSGNGHDHGMAKPDKIVKFVRQLRDDNPGTPIAIFPHWGLELKTLPEPADRRLAHRLIDAGADIIIGHHPHVIQPVEIYKGKTIAYSIGNFAMPNAQSMEKKFTRKPMTEKLMIVEWDGNENVKFYPLHFDPERCVFTRLDDFEIPRLDSSLKGYTKTYIQTIGRSHYLRFARWSDSDRGEFFRALRMKAYYGFRRFLIRMNLYKPY